MKLLELPFIPYTNTHFFRYTRSCTEMAWKFFVFNFLAQKSENTGGNFWHTHNYGFAHALCRKTFLNTKAPIFFSLLLICCTMSSEPNKDDICIFMTIYFVCRTGWCRIEKVRVTLTVLIFCNEYILRKNATFSTFIPVYTFSLILIHSIWQIFIMFLCGFSSSTWFV